MGVLEKESVILDNVEKKTTKDMAPLSGRVHQLQVNIFFSCSTCMPTLYSFCLDVCAHDKGQLNGMLYALCKQLRFNCEILMECCKIHWILFRQWCPSAIEELEAR